MNPSSPNAQPVSSEAIERSKTGPVAILKDSAPAEIRQIFPDGVPVKEPFPRIVRFDGPLTHVDGETSGPVLNLDPSRCSPETLFQLAAYLADQIQDAGGTDTAELILHSITEGAEIPLRMKHVRIVFLTASVTVLPCPCAKCTARRESAEGLVS